MFIPILFAVVYVAVCLYDFFTVGKTSWFGNIILASLGTGALCFVLLIIGATNKALIFLFR